MAGEDMCFKEVVSGFFAGVEVYSSDESADEVRAGVFDGDAFFEFALLVFEVEFGALGVVELGAFDFVAEVVVFDCSFTWVPVPSTEAFPASTRLHWRKPGSTSPPGAAAMSTPHSRVMDVRVLGPQ